MAIKMRALLVLLAAAGVASAENFVPRPEARIIDGELAAKHAAPYIVSICSGQTGGHICAGAIIDTNWVLTTASCLDDIRAVSHIGQPTVRAGDTNQAILYNGKRYGFMLAHKHKLFNATTLEHDLAVLRVQTLDFSASVQQATLPYAYERSDGNTGTTYGWGVERADTLRLVQDLRVAQATILNATSCAAAMPKGTILTNKQICASTPLCFGDRGNPLVIERPNMTAQLVGIASRLNAPCSKHGSPVVYTAVAPYIDYINRVKWAYETLHVNINRLQLEID